MTPDTLPMLRVVGADDLAASLRPPVDRATLEQADELVEMVRSGGEAALRELAVRFGEREPDQPLVLGRNEMSAALDALPSEVRSLLERAAARIRSFAEAQRAAIAPVDVPVPGGRAGHTVEPVRAAGCYAPNGRYPLPSSVLMTAITARAAGCGRVVVASPGADPVALGAAAVAGADEFLAVGGAHAIAAMAYGFEGFERCDVVVGPGNRWVTAAKQLVNGVVGIDMLAGPSELLVVADDSADPELVAADLLAQAEHDDDAVPMLVLIGGAGLAEIEGAIARRLERLPTAGTARVALRNGFVCVVDSRDEARAVADRIAAEHVEVMTANATDFAQSIRNAGALFIGAASAEVFGDYGAGPNHTLPTGGSARHQAGLSVSHFLRLRSWLRIDNADEADQLRRDSAAFAKLEGLAAHAASAEAR